MQALLRGLAAPASEEKAAKEGARALVRAWLGRPGSATSKREEVWAAYCAAGCGHLLLVRRQGRGRLDVGGDGD